MVECGGFGGIDVAAINGCENVIDVHLGVVRCSCNISCSASIGGVAGRSRPKNRRRSGEERSGVESHDEVYFLYTGSYLYTV